MGWAKKILFKIKTMTIQYDRAKILQILEDHETLVEALWAAADWCYTQKKDLEQTTAFMDELKRQHAGYNAL